MEFRKRISRLSSRYLSDYFITKKEKEQLIPILNKLLDEIKTPKREDIEISEYKGIYSRLYACKVKFTMLLTLKERKTIFPVRSFQTSSKNEKDTKIRIPTCWKELFTWP